VKDEVDGVAASLRMERERVDQTRVMSKRVEDLHHFKNEPVGRTRNKRSTAHLPPDHTFGKMCPTDEWGAAQVVRGNYALADQQADSDLGRSRRAVSKHNTVPAEVKASRIFGVPTIRSDLPTPTLRSVADVNNYGNEGDSKGLLYPRVHSWHGISAEDFLLERTPDELRTIMKAAGEDFTDAEFKKVSDLAIKESGVLSVDSYRHALNFERFTPKCLACQRALCVHNFCRRLECTHADGANHAPNAMHEFTLAVYAPQHL